jgi:hypothetical protein
MGEPCDVFVGVVAMGGVEWRGRSGDDPDFVCIFLHGDCKAYTAPNVTDNSSRTFDARLFQALVSLCAGLGHCGCLFVGELKEGATCTTNLDCGLCTQLTSPRR